MSAVHISHYHRKNKALPPWNTINVASVYLNASFETKPDDRVMRPVRKKLSYGTFPKDRLLTIKVDEAKEKVHLSRAADYCTETVENVFLRFFRLLID